MPVVMDDYPPDAALGGDYCWGGTQLRDEYEVIAHGPTGTQYRRERCLVTETMIYEEGLLCLAESTVVEWARMFGMVPQAELDAAIEREQIARGAAAEALQIATDANQALDAIMTVRPQLVMARKSAYTMDELAKKRADLDEQIAAKAAADAEASVPAAPPSDDELAKLEQS